MKLFSLKKFIGFKQQENTVIIAQIILLKNRVRFLVPAIVWLITCTILLTLPASAFPSDKWYTKIPMWDKWIHIGLFCILTFLFCWGIFKSGIPVFNLKKKFIQTAICCLLYGILMELIQRYFIPNRSFDPGDVIADGVGSLGGLFYSFRRFIKK